MPLYDYECARCGSFRALRPMSESDARTPCPACGAPAGRALSAPFLSGGDSGGWLTNPQRGYGRGSWRAACGLGCNHANCR